MENKVVAEVEIEDTRIEHYTSVLIRQRFNDHHEFIIRVNYDVLETYGSFSIDKAKDLIGKSAIIRLQKFADTGEVVYEFRGIVCEIALEQSHGLHGDLVIKGYSPTIVLEAGAHLTSFYKRNLKQIVQQITKPLSDNSCTVNINPQYGKEITYISQYKESTFHFLNRLAAEFGEWCYYDGKALNFGKPSSSPNITLTYGEDISSIQLNLRIVPMSFSNYSYVSKEDKFLSVAAPQKVNGLDSFGAFALDKSQQVFSEPVNIPVRQRIQNKSDLEAFIKQQKAAKAADLEVLSGRSDNPAICIGAVADITISKKEGLSFVKEDYGKFLITSVNHQMTENGKYYNTFEAIPSGVELIPVKNIDIPVAEPQIATVKDNKDPDKMGRVRVQMLWQQGNEWTDWIRVMTPDAGGGKDGAKNRGFVFIPEKGDQVIICFRYNDPVRPFVLGSMFHGKTAGGGGEGNKSKSLIALSGSRISMDGKSITVVDADEKSKLFFDGNGNIQVTSSETITLTCGNSSVTLNKDGTININGTKITATGKDNVKIQSGGASFSATAAGGKANMDGTSASVNGGADTTVNGGGKTTVSAGGKVAIQGAIVALN